MNDQRPDKSSAASIYGKCSSIPFFIFFVIRCSREADLMVFVEIMNKIAFLFWDR